MTTTVTIGEVAINATYTAVTGATGGSGIGAKFDITKINGVYTTVLNTAGTNYAVGDTITILGTNLGGTVVNNEIITIGAIGTGGTITTFGTVGAGRLGDGTIKTVINVTGTTGIDTYTFTDKASNFTVVNDLSNKAIVVTSALDTLVSFNLANHERIVFNDKAFAYDVTGVSGDVYALLKASLGTVSKVYEGIGIKFEDTGWTSTQIASAILGTDAFAVAAGGTGNESFVRQVYTNVMGAAPTLAQAKPFVDMLNAGTTTQASLLAQAAHLSAFQQTIGLIGVNGATGVLAGTGIEYTPY
jgi:hypothetical protein